MQPHKPIDEDKEGRHNGIKEDKVGVWAQYSGSVMNCGIFSRRLCERKCYKNPLGTESHPSCGSGGCWRGGGGCFAGPEDTGLSKQ